MSVTIVAFLAVATGNPAAAADDTFGKAKKTGKGVITNARLVKIEDEKRLGTVLGVVGGAAAGNFLNTTDRNKLLTTIGGAAFGGLIGKEISDERSKTIKASELTVGRSDGKYISVVQKLTTMHVGQSVLIIDEGGGKVRIEADRSPLQPAKSGKDGKKGDGKAKK